MLPRAFDGRRRALEVGKRRIRHRVRLRAPREGTLLPRLRAGLRAVRRTQGGGLCRFGDRCALRLDALQVHPRRNRRGDFRRPRGTHRWLGRCMHPVPAAGDKEGDAPLLRRGRGRSLRGALLRKRDGLPRVRQLRGDMRPDRLAPLQGQARRRLAGRHTRRVRGRRRANRRQKRADGVQEAASRRTLQVLLRQAEQPRRHKRRRLLRAGSGGSKGRLHGARPHGARRARVRGVPHLLRSARRVVRGREGGAAPRRAASRRSVRRVRRSCARSTFS